MFHRIKMSWLLKGALCGLAVAELCVAQDRPALRCRVVDFNDHHPIAGAQVLFTSEAGVVAEAKTGEAGVAQAVIGPPSAGRFRVTAEHPGFVPIRIDAYYPFDGTQVLVIKAAEKIPECELRMKARSSLGGVVRDSARKPLANLTVTALWRTLKSGAPAFLFAAETTSGPDGSFAMPSLLPGLYALRISSVKGARRLQTTTFPRGVDQGGQPLTLSAGTSITGLTIEVEEAEAVDLILRVLPVAGRLDDDAVTVMRGIDDLTRLQYSEGCCAKLKLVDNKAKLSDVPTGRFVFKVIGTTDGVEQEGSAMVDLLSGKTEAIDLVLSGKFDLAARLVRPVAAGGSTSQDSTKFTAIMLPEQDMTNSPRIGTVKGDFVIFEQVKPGRYRWLFNGLDPSAYVELRIDGRHLKGGVADLTGGAPMSVEARIQGDGGSLDVVEPERHSCVDVSLVVYPENEPRAIASTRSIDRDNCRFEVNGLPPGDYDFGLVGGLEEGEADSLLLRAKLGALKKARIERGQRLQLKDMAQSLVHQY